MEARVLGMREQMGAVAYADIAEAAGLPQRTVAYILTDLPRLRRNGQGEEAAAKSLKQRIYGVVEAIGEVKDVAELRRILGMADDEHSVLHTLHSLHSQGRIDFTERGTGMGDATVINIRLPKKGRRNGVAPTIDEQPEIPAAKSPDRREREVALIQAEKELGYPPIDATGVTVTVIGPEATTEEDPSPATPPSAPESEVEEYPLLDALLDRERKRLEGDSRGMAYITAAEAIEAIDPDQAAILMKKAAQFDLPFPSPIEREYLTYVAKHS